MEKKCFSVPQETGQNLHKMKIRAYVGGLGGRNMGSVKTISIPKVLVTEDDKTLTTEDEKPIKPWKSYF